MKKLAAAFFALVCVFSLSGCNTKSMNYIIATKPSVTGTVKEVHADHVIVYSETAAGYPNGSRWSVPLNPGNKDSYTDISVGDEIVFYYDGMAMETDPLRVSTVYAITLKTPAKQASWAIAAHVYLDGKGFFYNGKLTYELPDGYEYAGDVINVGNTFSGKDFEGNVDGRIYTNSAVSDAVYFSWAEWDEEKDGPAPFLKLEREAPESVYSRNADGTWEHNGTAYKYRLELTGRMPNASVDTTFVYLSNLETITFEQAWKAAGLSSHTDDYFPPEDAVLVEMNTH